jgi:hypothetical protein
VKIDATRYKLFLTNPEEYRLREIWGHVPTNRNDVASFVTAGRRRGTAFHELTDGKTAEELAHLGEGPVETAVMMHEVNQEYSKDTRVIWTEREFDVQLPDSPHSIVGRIDSLVERDGEQYIRDYKTTKNRTKEDMQRYRDELYQSPQVDFYLLGITEPVTKFVYQLLWKKPNDKIEIAELEVHRQPYELLAFQRSVHIVCETISFWKREFGTAEPWPRAVRLPVSPDFYSYSSIYQRRMYEGAELEGFEKRVEHLEILREGQ